MRLNMLPCLRFMHSIAETCHVLISVLASAPRNTGKDTGCNTQWDDWLIFGMNSVQMLYSCIYQGSWRGGFVQHQMLYVPSMIRMPHALHAQGCSSAACSCM